MSHFYVQPSASSEIRSPTQRAADGGYAPRFLGIFLAWSFSQFDGESTLPPTAANADHWAVQCESSPVSLRETHSYQ
jgi:hypothetical protein